MDRKDIFRTVVFGGYQKEDVADYIRSLENENETIRILTNKEKSDLKIQLEKEKAASEELKSSLAALHDKIARLEQQPVKPEISQNVPEVPGHTNEANHSQTENLIQKLAEEQSAIQAGQKLLAENLTQMRQDLQDQWQKGLEQLRLTWEDIQMQMERTPPTKEPFSGPSAHPDTNSAELSSSPMPVEEETEEGSGPEEGKQEELPLVTSAMEAAVCEDNMKQTISAPSGSVLSETASSQAFSNVHQTENEQEWSKSFSGASSPRYCQKVDTSISRTQKRIEDLLLELDNF